MPKIIMARSEGNQFIAIQHTRPAAARTRYTGTC
jgi:hypothetical protein